VVKHADASRAWIRLQARDGELRLVVEDNGKGIGAGDSPASAERSYSGYGLFIIRERLTLLGGGSSLESSAAGTRVSVWMPFDPDAPWDRLPR
jgi:signal transduction histidine kinase